MSDNTKAAIAAREDAKLPVEVIEPPKPRRKPVPVIETAGEYEAELDKPAHVPGEYVE